MGISESKCVNLEAEEQYLMEGYTVIRTDGKQQTEWKLSAKPHWCVNQDPRTWRPKAHAVLQKEGWRLHLSNDAEKADHACGWRRLGTFWPTRLTGDQTGIELWTSALDERLRALAAEQGLPSAYHEHTCVSGDGYQCSGCFWEARAKGKKEKRELLAALKTQLVEVEEEQETSARHDEMAALDARWDELDRQIHALEKELESL